MPSEPAREAAAGVLGDFIDTEEQLNALLPDPQGVEPLVPNEATEAEAEVEQPQEEDGLPEIQWETPDELRELLDGPDFEDEEDEPELEPVAEQEVDEYENPEAARLQKQLAKMQKKLAWAEEQKAKASQKAWAEEARKYFQFSDPSTIEAKSRRAFLKAAEKQHQTALKILKPHYDKLKAEREALKEQALAEARAEAEQRWGAPTTGPTGVTTITDTQTMRRERLDHGQSLVNVIKSKGYIKNL